MSTGTVTVTVPVGIVTGTNGKTTSVRIAKHLLQCAGKTVGHELHGLGIRQRRDRRSRRLVGSGRCAHGAAAATGRRGDSRDRTGRIASAGARRRNGGCRPLITNIAEDHLGDFGSQNVDELLDIKWVISHAVAEAAGRLVLNADDELLVAKSQEFRRHDRMVFACDRRQPGRRGACRRGRDRGGFRRHVARADREVDNSPSSATRAMSRLRSMAQRCTMLPTPWVRRVVQVPRPCHACIRFATA